MAQRGPRAQPTPGRTHPQTRGSCLSLLGRPQAPVSVGPLAPHPRRGHGSDPGRAPSPFRVPPARTRPRSRAGFGAAAGSGRRRRQVARPGPAPRPAPTIAPPPSLRARLRVRASLLLLRRLLPAAAAAREAMEAGAEAGAGAEGWSCPGQSAPPSPLHRRSFLFSIFPPCRPPRLPSLRRSHLPLPGLPPSIPPLTPGLVSIFPAGSSATGCILPGSSFLEPSPYHVCPAQGGSRPRTPSGPEGF